MKRHKGFTMVELMIAIVIVAILASVVAPMMRGRLVRARWSEAMGGCSAIATAIRSRRAETSEDLNVTAPDDTAELGFELGDLTGKYFVDGDYKIDITAFDPTLEYEITVTAGDGDPRGTLILDETGAFTLTVDSSTTQFYAVLTDMESNMLALRECSTLVI